MCRLDKGMGTIGQVSLALSHTVITKSRAWISRYGYLGLRHGASRQGTNVASQVMVDDGLGHLRATGVAVAKDQHGFFVVFDSRWFPVVWSALAASILACRIASAGFRQARLTFAAIARYQPISY